LEGINISEEVKELIEDDTFEYKIPFKDPDDLLKNFTSLEEKNLFLIQTTQEAEQAYEEKKQEFTIKKKKFDKELNKLQNDLGNAKDRISKIETDMTMDNDVGTDGKSMPPDIVKRVKNKVKEVYANVSKSEGRVIETSNSPVDLLSELENE